MYRSEAMKKVDKYSFLLIFVYFLFGFVGNLLTSCLNFKDLLASMFVIQHAFNILSLAVVATVVLSITRFNWTLSDWGFTLNRGCWISAGLVLVVLILLVFQGVTGISLTMGKLVFSQMVLRSTLEELVFRVLFINRLIALFGDTKGRIFIAVLASSLLFSIIHIPTKNVAALISIFTSSLLMGYVYAWTRSSLFPIYAHVASNTAASSGLLGGIISLMLYFSLAVWGKVMEKRGQTSIAVY